MNYERLVAYHRNKRADVTLGLSRVPVEDASRFGIVSVNRLGRVTRFEEKPAKPKSNLVSMGIYIFKKEVLVNILSDRSRKKEDHDFGKEIIPKLIPTGKVYGYRYHGYYRDVGTVDSYWQANMDLIVDLPELNLYHHRNRVRTALQRQNMPPVKLGPLAEVSRSIISEGAIINGKVTNSVISPQVFIKEDAQVYNSIIFNNATINQGAIIDHCIVDKQVTVGAHAYLGWGSDLMPNHEEPEYLKTGITLVGKRARIPEGIKIGHNCKIAPRTRITDFDSDTLSSGSSVHRKITRRH
jgi:glucose-1-phosphate adenylyltransferase